MTRFTKRLFVLSLLLGSGAVWGQSQETLLAHDGYTDDVASERGHVFKEVVYLDPNLSLDQPGFGAGLIDSKLSREFQNRYEDRFGYRQEESRLRQDQAITTQTSRGDVIYLEETSEQQRAFGSYMLRRLGEYHLDNYLKSDPKARRIYEVKEQLSQTNVAVSKNLKFDVKYHLSSNDVQIRIINPWLDNELRTPISGPSIDDDAILKVGKSLSSTTYVESRYKVFQEQYYLRWSKRLSRILDTALVATSSAKTVVENAVEPEGSSLWSIWTWTY